jgi:hypothetical protein
MIREGAMPSKYPALSWLCLSISKQFGPGSLEDPVSFESLSSRRRRRTWILQHLPGSAGAGSAAHAALQQADKASRSASPQETGSWVQGPRGGCVCVSLVPFLRQWNVVQEIRPRPCFVANYTDKDV